MQKPLAQSLLWSHLAPFMRPPQLPPTHCRPLTHWALVLHSSKQAPVVGLHENGTQMSVAPGLQRPAPSHANEPTTASPSQLPLLQSVPTTCLRQLPAPSHLPSRPQVLAAVAAQVVALRGLPPAAMPTHDPAFPGAEHVLHPSVQAVLQHTPSTQNPLAQSVPHVQA